jgi:hypothetical protein
MRLKPFTTICFRFPCVHSPLHQSRTKALEMEALNAFILFKREGIQWGERHDKRKASTPFLTSSLYSLPVTNATFIFLDLPMTRYTHHADSRAYSAVGESLESIKERLDSRTNIQIVCPLLWTLPPHARKLLPFPALPSCARRRCIALLL